MKLIDFFKQSDVLSDSASIHERRRIKELIRALYKLVGAKDHGLFQVTDSDWDTIRKAAFLGHQLYRLDSRSVEHIPYTSASRGLASVLYRVIVLGEPLIFLSFASHAIQLQQRKLREKKQYELPGQLIRRIENVMSGSGVSWKYEVILADDDYLVPRANNEQLWQENLAKLRKVCAVSSRFLSECFGPDSCRKYRESIEVVYPGLIAREALVYENNPSFLSSFKTNFDRNVHQMYQYACLGMMIEKLIPTCIVLDIQKRVYPYEQPYFNRFRSVPLPLFRCFNK